MELPEAAVVDVAPAVDVDADVVDVVVVPAVTTARWLRPRPKVLCRSRSRLPPKSPLQCPLMMPPPNLSSLGLVFVAVDAVVAVVVAVAVADVAVDAVAVLYMTMLRLLMLLLPLQLPKRQPRLRNERNVRN